MIVRADGSMAKTFDAPGDAPSGGGTAPRGMRRKILFVVTEDWFFASHFLPMARAARELGLEAVVATRLRDHADVIRASGARVEDLQIQRGRLEPRSILRSVSALEDILERERADIIHCIAHLPILVGGLAARRLGIERRVFALTGHGLFGARQGWRGLLARQVLRGAIRGVLGSRRSRYIFENPSDARTLALSPTDPRVSIVGGAGVDPARFVPSPLPEGRTLRVALVARMLWSKGIDTAVEAVGLARRDGADVTLSLFGMPDPDNPRSIAVDQLQAWAVREGVEWQGFTSDVAAVWRSHHLACLPSRGGEGLPRTLLEAAACGRPILTTDVPGCRDFVRDGVEGYVVPPEDAASLAARLRHLADDRALVQQMGRHARERVVSGYTERHVMDAVKAVYADLLGVGMPASRAGTMPGDTDDVAAGVR